MNLTEKTSAIQRALGFTGPDVDGKYGNATADAMIDALKILPTVDGEWHSGKASSFADPADVRAFRKCKAQGKTDAQCFKVGDNGIGKWGDDTTADRPMCALPPEDWEKFPNPKGKTVVVEANGRSVICELRDTMPHKARITNGAVIDLNPAACKALKLTPPVMADARWRWV